MVDLCPWESVHRTSTRSGWDNARKQKKYTDNWRSRKEIRRLKLDAQQQLTIKYEIPESQLNEEVENEIGRIKEIEKIVNTEDLIYETKTL